MQKIFCFEYTIFTLTANGVINLFGQKKIYTSPIHILIIYFNLISKVKLV